MCSRILLLLFLAFYVGQLAAFNSPGATEEPEVPEGTEVPAGTEAPEGTQAPDSEVTETPETEI